MKKFKTHIVCLFLSTVFFTCDNVDNKYAPTVTLNITVRDDLGNLVDGLGTQSIFMLPSEEDYNNSFKDKSPSNPYALRDFKRISAGVYEFTLDNPDAPYYILIITNNPTRNFNLSNFGISAGLKKLPKRAIVYLEIGIKPYDGNIVFYSTATNKMPIEIKLANFDSLNTSSPTQTLQLTTSGINPPTFALNDISAVWFSREPAKYAYYAKSADGCVWSGTIQVEKGKVYPVNLSKCEVGHIYFHTDATNSQVLPINVTLNGQNLTPSETIILSSVTGLTSFDCSTPASSSMLKFTRSKGLYNYFASSSDGSCVWTGSINLSTDECKFVKLNTCDIP